MEHRWGERIRVYIPVRLAEAALSRPLARIVNLSLSGACIEADHALRPLSRIAVILDSPFKPDGDTSPITAYVTRSSKNGAGVEWCEYAPLVITQLMHALHPHRGDRLRTSERPYRQVEALFSKQDF
jgi:hypothetical protein